MAADLTIIDQIEVTRARVIQIRLGLVELAAGRQDKCLYHRLIVAPGEDPSQLLAVITTDIARRFKAPPLEATSETWLQALREIVHPAAVVTLYRAQMAAQQSDLLKTLDGPRTFARIAGASFSGAPTDTERVSIVDRIVIPRDRRLMAEFGMVELTGKAETGSRMNLGELRPGADIQQLRATMTQGLALRGDPAIQKPGHDLLAAISAHVHSPEVVSAWQTGFLDWRQRVIAAGLDPNKRRPMIDPTLGLAIARARGAASSGALRGNP